MKCRLEEALKDFGPEFRTQKSDVGYERRNTYCNRCRRHFSDKQRGATILDWVQSHWKKLQLTWYNNM